jgi:hypothetical protein
MSDDGYLYFDETPKQCPGCGVRDTPAEDGPSYRMIAWCAPAGYYLCIDCRGNWAMWDSKQTIFSDTDENYAPAVVVNLGKIAKGETPNYDRKW